jgi:hypothetical protein
MLHKIERSRLLRLLNWSGRRSFHNIDHILAQSKYD